MCCGENNSTKLPIGPQGATGAQGPPGIQGPKGDTGNVGPQGIQGPQGPIGPIGLTGPTGPQGIQGNIGPQGPIGLTGPTGPAGQAFVYYTTKTTLPDGTVITPITISQDFTNLITIGVSGKYLINLDIDQILISYVVARSSAARALVHLKKNGSLIGEAVVYTMKNSVCIYGVSPKMCRVLTLVPTDTLQVTVVLDTPNADEGISLSLSQCVLTAQQIGL